MTFKSPFLAVALAGTLFVTACATMSIGSYRDAGADFARYRTFAWSAADALPVGDPRLDNNPLFQDYLQGAVERHLQAHGVMLVPASARPDLLVHFHGSVRQRVDVSVDRTRGYIEGGASVVSFDEGTLVLDLVDARTDRLIFRGWAVDSLSGIIESQDRMEKKIEEAVVKMLANFKAS